MSLWRHRQKYSNAMIGNFVITLAQIALTFAAVFLWFFGWSAAQPPLFRSPIHPCYASPVKKQCVNCSLLLDCAAPSRACWCLLVPAWQPVRTHATKQYGGCLCKTCLSLLKFWSPEELHTIWRL